jgi:hypothetical protein
MLKTCSISLINVIPFCFQQSASSQFSYCLDGSTTGWHPSNWLQPVSIVAHVIFCYFCDITSYPAYQVSAKCISLYIPVVHRTPSFSLPSLPTPTVPNFLCRYSWTVWPWRWKHYSCSKCWELPTQQNCITTQKTWIFGSSTVRISDLTNLIFCVTSHWKKCIYIIICSVGCCSHVIVSKLIYMHF